MLRMERLGRSMARPKLLVWRLQRWQIRAAVL